MIGFGALAYFVLSAPFRRIDCANMVVELNELAAATGKDPQQLFCELGSGAVGSVPHSRKFSKLYGLMENGHDFIDSLRQFYSLLPGEIFGAMELARKERSADLMAKLSKAYFEDGVSRASQSFKLFSSGLLILIPTSLMATIGAFAHILPKFKDVLYDMIGYGEMPLIPYLLIQIYESGIMLLVPALLISIMIFLTVSHLFNFSAAHNTKMYMNKLFSCITWLLPWRRNRIKRNFIWILCDLLDNGISESEGIKVAAEATKNSVICSRAKKAIRDLEKGQPLAQALRKFDRRADLAWRVENGAHGSSSFREALEGWTSHLSALAYKQQQSAFYYFFTAMTLINGILVLSMGLIFFIPFAKMMEILSLP